VSQYWHLFSVNRPATSDTAWWPHEDSFQRSAAFWQNSRWCKCHTYWHQVVTNIVSWLHSGWIA